MINRILSGVVTTGLCCVLLAACAVQQESSGLSLTFYGRIEQIEGDMVTLQPGDWEADAFTPDEASPTITVQAKQGLAARCAGAADITLEDLQVGTVVRFTVSANREDGEKLTQLEIIQQPG